MQKIKLPISQDKKVSPSKPDFSWAFKMFLVSACFIIITFLFFYSFSYFVVWNISIQDEKKYFGSLFIEEDMKKFDLNTLKTKVEKFADYDIYIQKSNEINAFATPWANILLTSAFLENIENEEELIFVIAHEIWHIEKRHILKRFSLEMPFYMSLSFLWMHFWDSFIDTNKLLWNLFSRNAEKQADKEAINFVNELWLNLKCAARFFEKLEEERFLHPPEILSTHPSDASRIKKILTENKNSGKNCILWEKQKS